MKICPNCKVTFPDGFQYCPNDTEALLTNEEYIQQTSARQAAAPVTVPTTDSVTDRLPQPPEDTIASATIVAANQVTEKTSVEKTVTPAGNTKNMAAALPSEPAGGLSFSVPEPENLVMRLVASIRQFIGDLGKATPQVRPGDAGAEFLLKEESLVTRFTREVGQAASDIRQDPKGFLLEVIKGEGTTKRRKQLMQAGVALAMIVYAFIFTSMLLLALFGRRASLNVNVINYASEAVAFAKVTVSELGGGTFQTSVATDDKGTALFGKLAPGRYRVVVEGGDCEKRERELVIAKGENQEEFRICSEQVKMVDSIEEVKAEKVPKEQQGKGGFTGGSKPKIEQAGGGGGGGRETQNLPSKGVPPKMSLTPPIIPPSVDPPKIKNPTLVVPMTALGDPKALPDMKGPIGDPRGVEGPPDPGSGRGNGIGTGSGGGVGEGDGAGVGRGRGMNAGGGDPNFGGGAGPGGAGGLVPYGQLSTKPVMIYKEKARYTEEARQNKIQGSVILSMVVSADGTVRDIKVVRGLPDGLTESAIAAARKMRFKPATKNGQPVATRLGSVEFAFNIY